MQGISTIILGTFNYDSLNLTVTRQQSAGALVQTPVALRILAEHRGAMAQVDLGVLRAILNKEEPPRRQPMVELHSWTYGGEVEKWDGKPTREV